VSGLETREQKQRVRNKELSKGVRNTRRERQREREFRNLRTEKVG
jgi:hypothetical protein